MEVKFAPSFTKSIRRMIWHESKVYKFYSIFRYDIWRFLANTWKFRKELYEFRPWFYSYNLDLFSKSIEHSMNFIKNNDIWVSDNIKCKKLTAMDETLHILNVISNDLYMDEAEKELGELPLREFNFKQCEDNPEYYEVEDDDTEEEKLLRDKIYERSREIEKEYWARLLYLLKGQDQIEFSNSIDELSDKDREIKYDELYEKWFDGSGIKGWTN